MNDNIDPPRWYESMPDDVTPTFQRGMRAYPALAPSDTQQARIWSGVSALVAHAHTPKVLRLARYQVLLGSFIGLALTASMVVYLAQRRSETSVTRTLPTLEVRARASQTPAESLEPPPPPAAGRADSPSPKPPTLAARTRPHSRAVASESKANSRPQTRMTPETAAASNPGAELDLLTRARRTLWSAPQRALELTAQHATTYPHGMFEQEREMIAIDALLRAGRRDEAVARAREFVTAHPQSAHVERLHEITHQP